MIKALIFDFDGLILDTETPDYIVWQEIYAEHGARLPIELWGQLIGGAGATDFDAAIHLEKLLGHPVDRPALNALWRAHSDELIAHQPIQPGVKDYLDDARRLGLRLAIASSSPHKWVDMYLADLGLLDYFEAILCAEDVRRVKPDPGLFLVALSALHLRAEEVIVFEDSPNGVKAAKSVGIFTVAVPNYLTRQLKVEGADILLNSLARMTLAGLLEQIGNELEIRLENPEDIPSTRAVNESAFGQVNEANLVDLIRSRGKASLSLVAARNGRVLGHILFSPVTLDSQRYNPHGVGLAPVAVLPEYQNQGIGSRLIRAGLQMCREAGWDFVIVVGNPAYYPRFGFIAGRCFGLSSSYGDSEAYMVMELKPGALKGAEGMAKYSPEFAEAGC